MSYQNVYTSAARLLTARSFTPGRSGRRNSNSLSFLFVLDGTSLSTCDRKINGRDGVEYGCVLKEISKEKKVTTEGNGIDMIELDGIYDKNKPSTASMG